MFSDPEVVAAGFLAELMYPSHRRSGPLTAEQKLRVHQRWVKQWRDMFDLPVEKGGGYQNVCERMLWRYRRLGTPPPSKKKTAAEQIRELREQNQ